MLHDLALASVSFLAGFAVCVLLAFWHWDGNDDKPL